MIRNSYAVRLPSINRPNVINGGAASHKQSGKKHSRENRVLDAYQERLAALYAKHQ